MVALGFVVVTLDVVMPLTIAKISHGSAVPTVTSLCSLLAVGIRAVPPACTPMRAIEFVPCDTRNSAEGADEAGMALARISADMTSYGLTRAKRMRPRSVTPAHCDGPTLLRKGERHHVIDPASGVVLRGVDPERRDQLDRRRIACHGRRISLAVVNEVTIPAWAQPSRSGRRRNPLSRP